ncbi:MAG: hypothetical protein HY705_04545 [Gemmatimonadetes bacterium]|nr:hypothetical protein [Gemmatimonadota bacterium]
MDGNRRVRIALLVGTLAGGMAVRADAQIEGMPLFTNPRYGTGVRVHGDVGQAKDDPTDRQVVQGGVTLAVGPVGLGANLGMTRDDFDELRTSSGTSNRTTNATVSAVAQIRVAGGGPSQWSLSLFGGASTQVNATDAADLVGIPQAVIDSLHLDNKLLTLPVGAALGLRIPLGLASLNLWGAPRLQIRRFTGCTGEGCSETKFRWAVGADLPIFRIISVRAAYDSGKIEDQTVSYIGVGASIGIGGMR